jgi:putative phage-type endonuclease
MEPINHYDGLGGTAASVIVGCNRHKTPYQLWLEYTDPETRQDLSDNEAIEWGLALEPVIAQVAAKRWGIEIQYQPAEIKHPRLSFMRAHVDALVVDERAGMEIKNRGMMMRRFYGEAEEDGGDCDDIDNVLPEEAIQCQTYMACTGYADWYLAVLTGGQRLLRFKIKRDDAIIAKIEDECETFWAHVMNGTPPEPVNSADAARRWPTHAPGRVIEADETLAELVEKRKALKAALKDSETDLEFVEFQLKRAMQDAEELRRGKVKLLSWKSHERDFFNSAQFKADYADLASQYTITKPVRVLR